VAPASAFILGILLWLPQVGDLCHVMTTHDLYGIGLNEATCPRLTRDFSVKLLVLPKLKALPHVFAEQFGWIAETTPGSSLKLFLQPQVCN
jgi:hypothetical protein